MPPLYHTLNNNATAQATNSTAATVADTKPAVVRVWNTVLDKAGLEIKVSALQHLPLDDTVDALFVLLGGVGLLRAFDERTGKLLGEWPLPGHSLQYEGLHLAPIMTTKDKFVAYLARDEPAAVFQTRFSMETGFDNCLNELAM